MSESFLGGRVFLEAGDCRDVLADMPSNMFHACVTDPPYSLVSIAKRFGKPASAPCQYGADGRYARASAGFMGSTWDTGETVFDPVFWAQVLRVLKPGAHLVAFGGTRTYHRLVCAIEDAGFEIRDCVVWACSQGFPKNHDVSKGIDRRLGAEREKVRYAPRPVTSGTMAGSSDTRPWIEKSRERGYHEADSTVPATDIAAQWSGWGSALKPSVELACLARKPLSEGSIAANVLRWSTGALNIDATRISVHGHDYKPPTSRGVAHNNHDDSNGGTCLLHEAFRMFRNGCNLDQVLSGQQRARHNRRSSNVSVYAHQDQSPLDLINDCLICSHCGDGFARSDVMRVPELARQVVDADTLRVLGSCPMREHILSGLSMSSGIPTPNIENRKVNGGRFPSNLIHDGSDEVVAAFPEAGGGSDGKPRETFGIGGNGILHGGGKGAMVNTYADSGSAARFFKTCNGRDGEASADRRYTEEGSTNFAALPGARRDGVEASRLFYTSKADGDDRLGSRHPCVKPLDLIQYLCRLICPPGGTILDCFAGTGTAGEAAFREGFEAMLIERDAGYRDDIRRRMSLALAGPDERARESVKARGRVQSPGPLFDGLLEAAE
jgi:DNA modification methylase